MDMPLNYTGCNNLEYITLNLLLRPNHRTHCLYLFSRISPRLVLSGNFSLLVYVSLIDCSSAVVSLAHPNSPYPYLKAGSPCIYSVFFPWHMRIQAPIFSMLFLYYFLMLVLVAAIYKSTTVVTTW